MQKIVIYSYGMVYIMFNLQNGNAHLNYTDGPNKFIYSDVRRSKEQFTRAQRLSDCRVQRVYQEGLVPGTLRHQFPDIVTDFRVQRLSDGRVQRVYQEGLVPSNLRHQLPDIVTVRGHRLPYLGPKKIL